METKDNNQGGTEDMMLKVRHKDTTEDELVWILADILVEAFIWQEEHKGEKPEKKKEWLIPTTPPQLTQEYV